MFSLFVPEARARRMAHKIAHDQPYIHESGGYLRIACINYDRYATAIASICMFVYLLRHVVIGLERDLARAKAQSKIEQLVPLHFIPAALRSNRWAGSGSRVARS
jgi:hypothetical protein